MKIIDLYQCLYKELISVTRNEFEAKIEAELVITCNAFSKIIGFELTKESLFGIKSDHELNNDAYKFLVEVIKDRKTGMPIQYILNEAWFYNNKFEVYKNNYEKTLIPRNETELIVEKSLTYISKINRIIDALDVGTGSGCIPISISLNTSKTIYWTAIDPYLNSLPKINTKDKKVDFIKYEKKSILDIDLNSTKKYDLITANLPYVPTKSIIDDSVKYEPAGSIFGGIDGLDYLKDLVSILPSLLKSKKSIAIMEIDPSQKEYFESLRKIFKVELSEDIQGFLRIATLNKKGYLLVNC